MKVARNCTLCIADAERDERLGYQSMMTKMQMTLNGYIRSSMEALDYTITMPTLLPDLLLKRVLLQYLLKQNIALSSGVPCGPCISNKIEVNTSKTEIILEKRN